MSVKVRFAPSPTGKLHVGNVRTAIANWLYARKMGGVFFLRIDDTDLERSTKEYEDGIYDDLKWLGLDWDETAKQSERFDRYDAAVEKLKADGRLYPCYETAQELELKRKIQLGQGKPPLYDRAALKLTAEEIEKYEAEGRTPHWRFKLNVPGRVEWEDCVKGHQNFDIGALSDPILVRGDGTYLYTLPSVVDDIDFGITHIMRGEDHSANSAVQTQVFEALGAKAPEMAHFSLLTGAKGEGLSKRLGSASIKSYREDDGLEAMSIVSLLARLGSSDAIEPFTDIQPLIDGFEFSKFSRATAKFDPRDLELLNAKILHVTEFDVVKDRLPETCTKDIWDMARANITKVGDVSDWLTIINGPVTPVIEDADFIAKAAALLPSGDWDGTTWKAWTTSVKEETGAKGKQLFMPLRQAVTGQNHGPEMGTLLPLIGAERVKARLNGEQA
ncbi:glutamate--tRNA ligase [Pseudemcibacter aquimaris]|uniref:glutamate--tRNA ligase n=1 Tax=Pseudemcibacter aquimaris TaxID=2857064 RepID=UPI002012DC5B|nr:glutamate--tRNA ligase [Pseudemcibacter aquimaris]MCC3859651.1 glutamate--tRNA ligase [Pseudemcibacter aquimaris]WDU60046.1 glutamate--tRNA ligase [Pseudemcibacter aquimaris]